MSKRIFTGCLLVALLAMTLPVFPNVQAQDKPTRVTLISSFQAALGCPKDFDPTCDKTDLIFNETFNLWQATFDLPAGDFEYKVALDGKEDQTVGAKATPNGENIALSVKEAAKVSFLYSPTTNWVADNRNSYFANVPGDYQKTVGCPGDWQPDCLISLLQDPDGDGKYTYTAVIPEGRWQAKVAINGSWAENYGVNGARDGANIGFRSLGKEVIFTWDSGSKVMAIEVPGAPKGDLTAQKAHWVSRDTFVWKANTPDPRNTSFMLHYDPNGAIKLENDAVVGGEAIALKYSIGVDSKITRKFPHLANSYSLTLPAEALERVPEILKGQLVLSAVDAEGKLLDATGVQIPGVLDDLFTYEGNLGLTVPDSGLPNFALWAPTARSVTLHIFANADPATTSQTFPMENDAAQGVWTLLGQGEWLGQYYLYEVEVFVPATNKVERNIVTDPYSISLSMNSARSQIIDIYDPALKPEGWDAIQKPPLAAPEDIVVYEMHVRDFSSVDGTVSEVNRGKFLAFTEKESNGMKHLAALQQAGLTHLHLLPIFDIATINEDASQRKDPDPSELAAFPADAENQQEIINATRDQDSFNWGYDPYHFNVPEGSYSSDPNGTARILELRQAVKALNETGLRVVMDVVYNHTNAAGQSDKSVFDKIVPGYYYRLDEEGKIYTSTCCPNTASEHAMYERFMIDSILYWVRTYKIDAFRFDLMGHHMVSTMRNIRAALDALTLENDGVDGKAIYLYGEGWNFGEVQDNARGRNATQINLAGTGIGTFSDRLRDAVRGGNPFGDREKQGFSSSLYTDPNTADQTPREQQLTSLLALTDNIKVGLAGNLKDFMLMDASGKLVRGDQLRYGSSPTGYTADPQEHIVYVSKHDNETIFDMIQYKAPVTTSMADRVRMNTLALSLAMFSQGVPFFHAGDDILRSKSLDRDSYNSGDWFNAIDWSLETTNWGKGLPIADKNRDMWPVQGPLLANPALKPTKADMETANARFRELLQMRRSSPLFRLQTAEDVMARVSFENGGAEQIPGLIVMILSDTVEPDLDPEYEMIVVLFNNAPEARSYTIEATKGMSFELHPVQANGGDEVIKGASFSEGAFSVPARSVAVFVAK